MDFWDIKTAISSAIFSSLSILFSSTDNFKWKNKNKDTNSNNDNIIPKPILNQTNEFQGEDAQPIVIGGQKNSSSTPCNILSDWKDFDSFKYLNNIIESDHSKLKRLINPTLGFKSMRTAYATIKGFEVMRMFKKGGFDFWKYKQGIQGEINLITNNLLTF